VRTKKYFKMPLYDPFVPNDYATFRRAQLEKRRLARAAEERSELQKSSAPVAPFFDPLALLETFEMSPEEIVRQRIAKSAAMGIRSAQEMERDEEELRQKTFKQQQLDSKSRIGRLVGQLSQGSNSVSKSQLVFAPSALAAGGHVIVESDKKSDKLPLRGKPSSTLLFRSAIAHEKLTDDIAFDIQMECGRHGVVRSAKVVDSSALSTDPPPQPSESVRVFIRMDTVASAFKAAEALNGQWLHDIQVVASFFSSTLYDSGSYERQPDEVPASF
jgi:hypothetical protein